MNYDEKNKFIVIPRNPTAIKTDQLIDVLTNPFKTLEDGIKEAENRARGSDREFIVCELKYIIEIQSSLKKIKI